MDDKDLRNTRDYVFEKNEYDEKGDAKIASLLDNLNALENGYNKNGNNRAADGITYAKGLRELLYNLSMDVARIELKEREGRP